MLFGVMVFGFYFTRHPVSEYKNSTYVELDKLNERLSQIVEKHKQAINPKLTLDPPKRTPNKSKTMREDNKDNKNKDKKYSLRESEIKESIDKLISEGLQNLLFFYKNKHKLISNQVSKLGVILYNFTSSQKKYDPEDLIKMENCEREFEINYLKV